MRAIYIILISIIIVISSNVDSQIPHVLYGFVFYNDMPAKNFSITILNHNNGDIIDNVKISGNYYQVDVGSLGWKNGDLIEIIAKGYAHKSNKTIHLNLEVPYQKVSDIVLTFNLSPPIKPFGPSIGYVGESYNFSTHCNATFNISYGWDWNNDNVVDEWSDWLSPDAICNLRHSWGKEGKYKIKVRAKSEFGLISNWSEPLTIKIEKINGVDKIDKSPPDTYIINFMIDDNKVFFEWYGRDDLTNHLLYSYIIEGYSNWSKWSYDTNATFYLPNGDYIFKVKAKDKAGNVDLTPAKLNFTINVTLTVSIISPVQEELFGKVKIRWDIKINNKSKENEGNIYISIFCNNETLIGNVTNISYYIWDTTKFRNGNYSLTVYARDLFGNVGMDKKNYIIINKSNLNIYIYILIFLLVTIFLLIYIKIK